MDFSNSTMGARGNQKCVELVVHALPPQLAFRGFVDALLALVSMKTAEVASTARQKLNRI
jgi:ethanolamine utilization cobalamin adenosyltransferase